MQLSFMVRAQETDAKLYYFLRAHGVSASLIRSIKTHGGFFCDGCEIHTNQRVARGSTVSFALPPERETTVLAQAMPLSIAYENMHAMLLNKPAGLTVHPTLGYPDGTLANAFCGEMQRRGAPRACRPINRIDRNTSGLVLCALQEYAAPLLAASAQKVYYAIAQGSLPDSGEIDAPIGLRDGSFIQHAVRADGKPSVTRYRTLWRGNGHSLAAVQPVTGRTHQIRVHFAHLGHPLAGDDFYGGSTQYLARHALHCGRIAFADIAAQYGACVQATTGTPLPQHCNAAQPDCVHCNAQAQTITVSCPLPSDMAALLPAEIAVCWKHDGGKP